MLMRSRLPSIAAVEFDRLVHRLERDPGAGEARHRPAVEPVIEDLLHAGGVQDRDHHVDEVEFGLVRGGGGFGGVVVAHQRQHAAVLGGAGEIGVAEHVAGAVDARALAVPHAEDAVELAFAAQLGLLRAPHRGRGEILVDAGLEADVALLKELMGALELAVEAAERRAAIAGDEARRVEAVAPVALLLHQAEPHQRLEAGDEDAALAEVVFIVEFDVAQRHPGGLHRRSLPLRTRDCQRAAHAHKYGVAIAAEQRSLCPIPTPKYTRNIRARPAATSGLACILGARCPNTTKFCHAHFRQPSLTRRPICDTAIGAATKAGKQNEARKRTQENTSRRSSTYAARRQRDACAETEIGYLVALHSPATKSQPQIQLRAPQRGSSGCESSLRSSARFDVKVLRRSHFNQ